MTGDLCRVAGVVLLVISFALGIVEPAQSYTVSWAQLVWGMGIWPAGSPPWSPA